jgi:hypothetical protein
MILKGHTWNSSRSGDMLYLLIQVSLSGAATFEVVKISLKLYTTVHTV